MAEPCSGRAREVPENVEAGPLMAQIHRSRRRTKSGSYRRCSCLTFAAGRPATFDPFQESDG